MADSVLTELDFSGVDFRRDPVGAGYPTPPAPLPRTLMDVFADTVENHPAAWALDDGETCLDYQGLAERVERRAGELRALGIGPGDRVGVSLPSGRAELYIGILSVLAAGAAYVPTDVDEPAERTETIFREAAVCAVLRRGDEIRLRPELARPRRRPAPGRTTTSPGRTTAGPGESPGIATDPDIAERPGSAAGPGIGDDAWIIFTSGSSGTPKGVAVRHRAAAAFVDAEARLFLRARPLGPGDRVLAGLSVGFDASCEEMWLAWRHGACLVPAPRAVVRTGADLGPWLAARGITVVSTVPTLAAMWPAEALRQVRLLIVGGEACPPDLVERFDDGERELWNTYGPTEATVVSTATRLRAGEPVRIGLPLPGWRVAVVGPDGRPVGWGETGELVIGGVGLARYLDTAKDRAAYPAMPRLGWQRGYRSGDLVRAEPEGLAFVGRADHQVKIGGRRIELGEVEAALLDLPGVAAATAVVRGGMVLVGYLLLEDPAAPFDHDAARAALEQRLPHGLTPRLAVLPDFPLNAAGKVDRKALPWPLPDSAAPSAPATSKESVRNSSAGARPLEGDIAWIAGHWRELFGTEPTAASDFFAEGGTSLAAARLISLLRKRFPQASVTDLYRYPVLGDLAERLSASAMPRAAVSETPAPLSKAASCAQGLVSLLLMWFIGARWAIGVLLSVSAFDALTGGPPVSAARWATIAVGCVTLLSTPGRVLLSAAGARLLTARLRPGSYRKGSRTHLRLWAAERLVTTVGATGTAGTPWNIAYARLLGNTVGRDVDLHSPPPVSGLGTFGDGCAVEPETDLSGWWLDGDVLHVGTVEVGARASVGGRSTLMPGGAVGAGARVGTGTCVEGVIPAGETWTGSPAVRTATARTAAPAPRTLRWQLVYGLTPAVFGAISVAAMAPTAFALAWLYDSGTSASHLVWLLPLLAVLGLLITTGLTATLIRAVGRWLRVGDHPVHSRAGWSAWVVQGSTTSARDSAFALYASLLTGPWLRLLGAAVGRRSEVSTVVGIPSMMSVGAGGFLADDASMAPYRLRNGLVRVGPATVGDRAFVGNSAEVPAGRRVLTGSLIGVLSQAPERSAPGTSWLGRPAIELTRRAESGDRARTFEPARRLVVARSLVEATRLVPLIIGTALAYGVFIALSALADSSGTGTALALSGPVVLAAGVLGTATAVAAKWLLLGRVRQGEHPLWSNFVWRNELVAVYYEELVVRWLGTAMIGTPLFNVVLRAFGARIGKGVCCETRWLPEPDLVSLGDGAVVNRGCVVQTHLFQDRILRLGPVRFEAGTTLGPHSIALFDTRLEAGSSTGANSLVMRGETLPAAGRFTGNPVAPRAALPRPPR